MSTTGIYRDSIQHLQPRQFYTTLDCWSMVRGGQAKMLQQHTVKFKTFGKGM